MLHLPRGQCRTKQPSGTRVAEKEAPQIRFGYIGAGMPYAVRTGVEGNAWPEGRSGEGDEHFMKIIYLWFRSCGVELGHLDVDCIPRVVSFI